MKVVYVDPMSYRNMADYDKSLIDCFDCEVIYYCSYLFPYDIVSKNRYVKKVFFYNKKKNNVLKIFSYFVSWLYILHGVYKYRPSAIHVQWVRAPRLDLIMLWLAKIISNAKLVYTAHNVLPHNSGTKYLRQYYAIYSCVDSIIVHAKRSRCELLKLYPVLDKGKISVIPHGLLGSKKTIKGKVKSNKVVYLCIGEITRYKGIREFVLVWRRFIKSNTFGSKVPQLLIKGRCEKKYLDQLNQLIGDDQSIVFIPVELSDCEFDASIEAADILVLPYLKGSQSGVLLKAIAQKKMILVSKVGGLDEPLAISNIGWSFDWSKKDDLISAINQSYNFISSSQSVNMDDWKKLTEYYGWESIAHKTQALYKI